MAGNTKDKGILTAVALAATAITGEAGGEAKAAAPTFNKEDFDAAVAAAVAEKLAEGGYREFSQTAFDAAVAEASAARANYDAPAFLNDNTSANELNAADAAKLVTRTVIVPPKEKGADATTKEVAVGEDEVLDFKDYGDHVVVVTKDGKKFTGAK